MMRIYFCSGCKCWRMVSDRLQATCLRCGTPMFMSDIPFEHFTSLNLQQRQEITDLFLTQVESDLPSTVLPYGKRINEKAGEVARERISQILGIPVLSNRPAVIDTGYDY